MAQGRGNAYASAFILIVVGLQWHLANGVTYTVGGAKGWDLNVDYTAWATGLTFKVGDILFFPYGQGQHNVVVVNKAGYDDCSPASTDTTFSEGNTSVTLSTAAAHYYLCSLVGHCGVGMKLAVNVSATGTAATPTASPPATAPTPSQTPSSSPMTTPAPSSAPSSASTPSFAPAPTPSSPAPAPSSELPVSAPAPSSPTATGGPPASAPAAPGSPPSPSAGTPPASPPPLPNAAHSLLASAALMAPLLAPWAALFI